MAMGASSGKGGGIREDHDSLTRLARQAQAIERLSSKWAQARSTSEVHLLSVSIHLPKASRYGGWLLVAKGWYDGQRYVAFVRGETIISAMASLFTQWSTSKLNWKVDEYADKPFLKGQ